MFGLVPFRSNSIYGIQDEFEDLISNFFNDRFFTSGNFTSAFNVDLRENDKAYLVTADLPGVNKENINVEFNNNTLSISAKIEDVIEDNRNGYIAKESHYGQFQRNFYLDGVDENKIMAKFENGILNIVLPKKNKNIDSEKIIEVQ